MPFPIKFTTMVPLVATLCYIVLFMILFTSRKKKLARFYLYYISVMVIWSLGSFMMKVDTENSLMWNRVLVTGMTLYPIMFYHFTMILTKTTKTRFRNLGYFIALSIMISNIFGLVITSAAMVNGKFTYELGPMASVLAIYGVGYTLISLLLVLQKVKSGELPLRRVRLIIIGIIVMDLSGLLNLFPIIGQFPLDILANTVNAIFVAYSIYRYKFLEINYIVKRSLTYTLYTAIVTTIYIGLVVGLQRHVVAFFHLDDMNTMLVFVLFFAIALEPFRKVLQKLIDRVFYRVDANHKAIFKKFSDDVNHVLDLHEIVKIIQSSIRKAIGPKTVHLLIKRHKESFYLFNNDGQMSKYTASAHKLDQLHPLMEWFDKNPILTVDKLEGSPLFTSLWKDEKRFFAEIGAEVIVPITNRETCTGFLMLSGKMSDEAYTKEEIDLLVMLMSHVSVVLENAKMYEVAKQQAITDGLTHLYNHRYFHEILGDLCEKKRVEKFAVGMFDIDLFKFYNDVHGHSLGDKILIKVAETLTEFTRDEDIVVRFGGEEFAVIFLNLCGKKAFEAAEKLRKAVEERFNQFEEVNEFITISGGIACYPDHGVTAEELVDHADQALYSAKNTGRNKTILYNPNPEIKEENEENRNIRKMKEQIKSAYLSSIYALAATIDAKDAYTFGHSENVSNLSVLLGQKAGFSEKQLEVVKNAGLLHDVGKIGIPEYILTKPGKLTDEEFDIMKKHVDISITIIKHVPNLVELIPAIMTHHEQFDGSGYPRGLKGEQIPIEGRCLAVVDAFDAMITDRPYRKALHLDEAIDQLKKHRGTQFDPFFVDCFLELQAEGKLDGIHLVNRLGEDKSKSL